MKKNNLLFLLLVGVVVPFTSGCSFKVDSRPTIRLQFVPSIDPGKLATLASKLKPFLEEVEPNYNFQITTGISYAACVTGMLSNQIDICFLPASGYAEATLKNPQKLDVLLTSVRKSLQVQLDFKSEEEQIKAMNQEVEGYEYLGQESDVDVNYYCSSLIVDKKYYVDKNEDGKIDIYDMVGLTVGRQGSSSGAGYLRPLKYLHDHGLTMVDSITDSKTQLKGINFQSGYTAACDAMMQGDIAGFWGYTDVRLRNYYLNEDNAHYLDKSIFYDYKVVAITDKIYNDTITCRANLEQEKKDAVVNALKTLITRDDYKVEGTGAYYLYKIYSHTGYIDAVDSDFDGERDFYQFCIDNDLFTN